MDWPGDANSGVGPVRVVPGGRATGRARGLEVILRGDSRGPVLQSKVILVGVGSVGKTSMLTTMWAERAGSGILIFDPERVLEAGTNDNALSVARSERVSGILCRTADGPAHVLPDGLVLAHSADVSYLRALMCDRASASRVHGYLATRLSLDLSALPAGSYFRSVCVRNAYGPEDLIDLVAAVHGEPSRRLVADHQPSDDAPEQWGHPGYRSMWIVQVKTCPVEIDAEMKSRSPAAWAAVLGLATNACRQIDKELAPEFGYRRDDSAAPPRAWALFSCLIESPPASLGDLQIVWDDPPETAEDSTLVSPRSGPIALGSS